MAPRMPEYIRYFCLRKIQEVEQRAASGDYYDTIMAAGLMRHLLIDDVPLIHRANRDLRFKFRYTIARTEGHYEPGPSNCDVRGIDPGSPPYIYPIEVVREAELLSAYCMTISDERFTVKDILESCAYVRGGVHIHESLTWRDELLFSIDFHRASLMGTTGVMRGIIKVVLEGIRPLTNAIAAEFN